MEEDLKRIAYRIRRWRDEAGLTLQQVADRAGVSASTIHKIENLQTVPTIRVVLKVAHGLNRSASELLVDVDTERPVAMMREGERHKVKFHERASLERLVGLIPRHKIDVWRVRIQPGFGPGKENLWRFKGEMVILVEDGVIDAEIAGEQFRLGPGDSIHFDPSEPHRWVAGGEMAMQAIIIATIDRIPDELKAQLSVVTGAEGLGDTTAEVLADNQEGLAPEPEEQAD